MGPFCPNCTWTCISGQWCHSREAAHGSASQVQAGLGKVSPAVPPVVVTGGKSPEERLLDGGRASQLPVEETGQAEPRPQDGPSLTSRAVGSGLVAQGTLLTGGSVLDSPGGPCHHRGLP